MPRTIAERADILPKLAECFRRYGYEGASIARISKSTGLGKGSLYHFFPGGKAMMADTVLAEISAWFETAIFEPLENDAPERALNRMFDKVTQYFQSGRCICLVGAFALDDTRDLFAQHIKSYFDRWLDSLHLSLVKLGQPVPDAGILAMHIIAGIQGAIILSRSANDTAIFTKILQSLHQQTVPQIKC